MASVLRVCARVSRILVLVCRCEFPLAYLRVSDFACECSCECGRVCIFGWSLRVGLPCEFFCCRMFLAVFVFVYVRVNLRVLPCFWARVCVFERASLAACWRRCWLALVCLMRPCVCKQVHIRSWFCVLMCVDVLRRFVVESGRARPYFSRSGRWMRTSMPLFLLVHASDSFHVSVRA